MENAVVTIRRTTQLAEVVRSFRVEMDGEKVDRIWSSETRNVHVAPGAHSFQVMFERAESPALTITVAAGEHVGVVCGRRGNALTSMFWKLFDSKSLTIASEPTDG